MPQASSIAPSAAKATSMAHAGGGGGASSSTTSRPAIARPVRLTSAGSFHAGAPMPSFPGPYDAGRDAKPGARRRTFLGHLSQMRRHSTYKYHTFPTQPPKTPSDAPDSSNANSPSEDEAARRRRAHRHTNSRDSNRDATPLPVRQLLLLALLSLAEQTALNSIGPYLPAMVAAFPEIPQGQAGLYVGLLASSFALAQLMTNFLWGYFSDRLGRKPIMLIGTALLCICFAFFGFCDSYWHVLVVHVAMGLLNGNAAVVPTVLGEVTDRSNQSRAFTWLPVMYSLGGVTGPALGGLLVRDPGSARWPFLGPNLMSAALLLAAVVVLAVWFQETLDEADARHEIKALAWLENLCVCSCLRSRNGRDRSRSTTWPTSSTDVVLREEDERAFDEQGDTGEEDALLHSAPDLESQGPPRDNKDSPASSRSALRKLLNWTTVSILLTYLIFQVANISFNSLYPIFASAPPPTGRELGPGVIGVSMSLAGLVTILFQVSLFEPLKARLGNLGTFRLSLLGLALSMAFIPFVGYRDGNAPFGWGSGRSWLLVELGVILVLKNLSAVGGLSCVLLLITNSAPTHETLGSLNGIAQTLSAAGRSFGPFASGGLFTLSMRLQHKGELLAWGVFSGIALVGWGWALFIRGGRLESDDFLGDESTDYSDRDHHSENLEGGAGYTGDHSASIREDELSTTRRDLEREW
ncbi:MFS transporter [Diaporthe helianthi]|uniref:MFS transporter n=1 Tax=Diaporthe helianthi TaxID=158607 RepID=A0A2P5HFB3_DIAHE|nr:MFS transporter [Diaporthe helianthi]